MSRKFLHDMSNSLLIAQGMNQLALQLLKSDQALAHLAKIAEKLEKTHNALEKMGVLLKEERELLQRTDAAS